jgi:hypothetical protein
MESAPVDSADKQGDGVLLAERVGVIAVVRLDPADACGAVEGRVAQATARALRPRVRC